MKKKVIIICAVLLVIFYLILQNNWIQVEHINVKVNNLPKELEGLKIAQISDVHIPKNATSIDTLLKKVKSEKPDIILITGDIIDESADIENCELCKLCKGLSEIADTYAVSGNHEVWNNNLDKWYETLKQNNVKVVDNKILIYEKNNTKLAIMGLSDNTIYNSNSFDNIQETQNMPKIFLAHRPELLYSYCSSLNSVLPDLVFCGHAHGGQFRIPFINKGLIAPNQGFLPKYTSGLYKAANKVQMIVSRGLGNSIIPIRINNRPHLPIITLKK